MDDRFLEIKSAAEHLFSLMEKELLAQREEIEELKKAVEQLQKGERLSAQTSVKTPAPAPAPAPVPASVPVPAPVPASTFAPAPEPPHHKQVEEVFSLDDDTVFEVHDLNDKMGGKQIIGELFSNDDSVADYAIKNNQPWMTDIPGPKVNTIEEALSLNDRMFFVRELFGGDDDQFDLTLERINETATFKEVVNDMRAAFPEWDETSNGVYRFYMVIRRKFRD